MSRQMTQGETTLTTPTDTTLVMERHFDAPRELVWRLWNDPALIPNFWGPRDTTARVEEYALEPGGSWRIVNIMGDGREIAFLGEFHWIEQPRLISWTFGFEGMPGEPGVEELHLIEQDGGTLMRTVSYFPTLEVRDSVLGSGMVKGASEMHDRFAELLDGHFEA